jgi:hypothetical protein
MHFVRECLNDVYAEAWVVLSPSNGEMPTLEEKILQLTAYKKADQEGVSAGKRIPRDGGNTTPFALAHSRPTGFLSVSSVL